MTMLETKTELEEALYNNNRISYDAIINAYIAVIDYLKRNEDKNIEWDIDLSKIKV